MMKYVVCSARNEEIIILPYFKANNEALLALFLKVKAIQSWV